jgi:hypothetical protein
MAESGKRLIMATATLDFGSVSANDDAELTASVGGAEVGQVATVSAPSLDSGLVASAYVSAAGTVTVRVSNVTAGAIDPASQDFYLAVTQP